MSGSGLVALVYYPLRPAAREMRYLEGRRAPCANYRLAPAGAFVPSFNSFKFQSELNEQRANMDHVQDFKKARRCFVTVEVLDK